MSISCPRFVARAPWLRRAALSLALASGTAFAQPIYDLPPEDAVYSVDPDDANVADVVFFLAPWGNPNTTWLTCTEQTPFLTLEQARLQIRMYKEYVGVHNQRIQVRIAGGVYPMAEPVVFTANDSGWPNHMIQYVGANLVDPEGNHSGDDALFSGGLQITGWCHRPR
jgi:hypothetical protein